MTLVSFGMASIPWGVLCEWELWWFHLPLACWVNSFSQLLSSLSAVLTLFCTMFFFFFFSVYISFIWLWFFCYFGRWLDSLKCLINKYLSCKQLDVCFYNYRENNIKQFLYINSSKHLRKCLCLKICLNKLLISYSKLKGLLIPKMHWWSVLCIQISCYKFLNYIWGKLLLLS